MSYVEVIKRCQQGEREAFEELFKQYGRKAGQTAFLITRRKDLSEDVTQEAFIQCYRQIHSLKQPDRFHVWFYQILVRISLRIINKEKRRALFYSPNLEWVPDDNENVYEEVRDKEIYQTLYQALNTLRQPLRTVVILYYFNDLSLKEISEVLSCREGTVKSRLHNARKKLLEKMQSEGVSSASFYFNEQEGGYYVRKIAEGNVK